LDAELLSFDIKEYFRQVIQNF